jgi:hypothetical protein
LVWILLCITVSLNPTSIREEKRCYAYLFATKSRSIGFGGTDMDNGSLRKLIVVEKLEKKGFLPKIGDKIHRSMIKDQY